MQQGKRLLKLTHTHAHTLTRTKRDEWKCLGTDEKEAGSNSVTMDDRDRNEPRRRRARPLLNAHIHLTGDFLNEQEHHETGGEGGSKQRVGWKEAE